MADPINLRQFKKRKLRAEKEKLADENRKKFGVSTKLKKASKANNKLTEIKLDGTKRDISKDSKD